MVMEGLHAVGEAVKTGVRISAPGVDVPGASASVTGPKVGRLQPVTAIERMSRAVNNVGCIMILSFSIPSEVNKVYSYY